MLSLILDVDALTLTIFKLEFAFIFLEFNIYLRASSQKFVENYQFNVILSYLRQSCRAQLPPLVPRVTHREITPCQFEHHVRTKFATPILYAGLFIVS